jgi:hypothetical protein
MTRLAAWIMASPLNAVLATLLLGFSGIFGWAAAVPAALVGLRKGALHGALPLAAAFGIAVFHWSQGELTLLGTVFATWGGALALGATRTLLVSLLVTVGITAIFVALLQTVASSQLATLFEQYQQVIGSLNSSGAGEFASMTQAFFSQLMGIWVATSAMVSVFIARSLQARLFNPGGFRQEFHGMRLTPLLGALCVTPLLLIQMWPESEPVAGLFLLPVLMAGVALVHGIVGRKQLGAPPLVIMYLGLALIAPVVTPVLLIAALADSFFDFRNRLER